ncbi:MAG: DUF2177 family protein [Alphaproteobacteria bacterium]|nr:DUF2177 family protein [Alphaproteobacteria bacterium]
MTKVLVSYGVTLIAFLAIDFFWLGWIAKSTYVAEMGDLMRKDPNLVAAAAFYLLYAAGLTLFAVLPGLKADSAIQAIALGAAFGLIAYATYDLTNLSVLNGFSLKLALIDMAWGTFASAAAVACTFFVAGKIFSA